MFCLDPEPGGLLTITNVLFSPVAMELMGPWELSLAPQGIGASRASLSVAKYQCPANNRAGLATLGKQPFRTKMPFLNWPTWQFWPQTPISYVLPLI